MQRIDWPADLPEGDWKLISSHTIGYQGPAQHTYTPACDGFHQPGACPLPPGQA